MIKQRLKSVNKNIEAMEGLEKLIGNAKTKFGSMGLPEEVAKKLKEGLDKVKMDLANIGNVAETPLRNIIKEMETIKSIHKP